MKWTKVLRKGLEAGVPAALAALGLSQEISLALGVAIVGFIFGSAKNFIKHFRD